MGVEDAPREPVVDEQDPLAVIVSNRLELPWDAGLFTDGGGQVVVFTASEEEHPETATPVTVIRHPDGVDLALCERVTRHLDQLRADYTLEVSSPGPKYRRQSTDSESKEQLQ